MSRPNLINPHQNVPTQTPSNTPHPLPQFPSKQEVERAKKSQKEDFPQGIPECGTDALRCAELVFVFLSIYTRMIMVPRSIGRSAGRPNPCCC